MFYVIVLIKGAHNNIINREVNLREGGTWLLLTGIPYHSYVTVTI